MVVHGCGRLIEEEEGRGIPRIFRENGEEGVSRIEHRIAGRLLLEDDVVVRARRGLAVSAGQD